MKIIQLTNSTPTQMEGYVVQSKDGHLIAIDGGQAMADKEEMERILGKLGNHVDLWLITHPHSDHHNAVIMMFSDPNTKVTYDWMAAACPSDEWSETFGGRNGPTKHVNDWNAFLKTQDPAKQIFVEAGMHFTVGTMEVEVISGNNTDCRVNPVNNQSCVYRITEDGFSFLVLGDLGEEVQDRVLNKGIDLHSDAVQMAHHGQAAVNEAFYQAVSPKYAFWPTPDWLWENRSGYAGRGERWKGHFQTPIVHSWMEKLGAISITNFDYSIIFDSEDGSVKRF